MRYILADKDLVSDMASLNSTAPELTHHVFRKRRKPEVPFNPKKKEMSN